MGVGETIYQLRKRIQYIQAELDSLGDVPKNIPELMDSANVLRKNEFLSKLCDKQSELIYAYSEYSKSLEQMLSAVFEIQNDLKNLLKEQTRLLSTSSRKISRSRR